MHFKNFLCDSKNYNVSNEEYLTYLTPEGELYDKSVIPHIDSQYDTVRIKRENKVYSYKEQLEEIQLRREIDEKRQKEGKSKTIKLTQKQEEQIKNQTEKELRIRLRIGQLHEKLISKISLLKASCDGNGEQLAHHFYTLLNDILQASKSPLSAKVLTNLYLFLHKLCFKLHPRLGRTLAVATIKLQNPSCILEAEYDDLNLTNAIPDIIFDLDNHMKSCLFDSPSFSYAFEFIKRAILFLNIDSNTEVISKGIKIIALHTVESAKTTCNPKFMPRLGMFEILLYLFKNNIKLREQTASAIKDVARYSNEDAICAETYNRIISIFLEVLQYNSDPVRNVALQALKIMVESIKSHLQVDGSLRQQITARFWIAKFDSAEENRDLANDIWNNVDLSSPKFDYVIYDITHPELCIQKSASESLMPLIAGNEDLIKCAIKTLFTIYNEMLALIPPVLDQFDREVEPSMDQWKPRRGVAIAFSTLAPILSIEDINVIMHFMVSQGLGDRKDLVHKEMLAAALKIVDIHGNRIIVNLLPVFEDFLDKAPKSQSYDNIRQAVVILMGSLARHLEKNDNRIDPIVKRLLTALSTPSQQVQEAVSNCLPHLMPSVKDEAPAMIKKLLHSLAKSDKYGERRGAAYGIAGIVKGLGILSLKQLDIMSKLTAYIQEKRIIDPARGPCLLLKYYVLHLDDCLNHI